MKQRRSGERFWLLFAASAVVVIIAAAIRWSLNHPYGIHWDEAEYLNDSYLDAQRLLSGHLLKLGGRMLLKGGGRPPAYRLFGLPFVALFGFHALSARLVSLACFALSAGFIYLATCRIASRAAGALAVLIFALSAEIIGASIFFSTDAPLYLATSALLYYLFVCWSDTSERPSTWVGFGLAVGLGFLAKPSFLAIVLPVLAFWLVLGRSQHLNIPSLASQRKAGALAFLIAAPWWLLNLKSSIAMTQQARAFARDSLGPPSLVTWMRWLSTVLQGLLGLGVSIVIALILLSCLVKVIRRQTALSSWQKAALGACACAGVPIVLAQLSGTNHLLRHISPAVIPLAIAVGVIAEASGWLHSRTAIAVSTVLLGAQLLLIVSPVVFPNKQAVDMGFVNTSLPWRVMSRFDQWDWRPLRPISHNCGVESPTIAYLGSGREFDPPHIQYPWVVAATATRLDTFDFPDVTWLWRYEDGTLDWQKVQRAAEKADIVVTAPGYVGEARNHEDLDNRYNTEFAARLSRDPLFGTPLRLAMGRFEPVELEIFVKKALPCRH